MPNGGVHMGIFPYQPPSETCLWEYDGATIEECQNAFLEAPTFNGKTFWDAEQQIEWVDC